jgi:hypothetical protein
MGMPHRNDTARAVAGSPDQRNAATVEKPPDPIALFAIILPVIQNLRIFLIKNKPGIGEIEASFSQNFLPFGSIETDPHEALPESRWVKWPLTPVRKCELAASA